METLLCSLIPEYTFFKYKYKCVFGFIYETCRYRDRESGIDRKTTLKAVSL